MTLEIAHTGYLAQFSLFEGQDGVAEVGGSKHQQILVLRGVWTGYNTQQCSLWQLLESEGLSNWRLQEFLSFSSNLAPTKDVG